MRDKLVLDGTDRFFLQETIQHWFGHPEASSVGRIRTHSSLEDQM